jgi:UDP-N-acetylmuramoyl-tripeptide--D-alanyl-D-alanine ligase
VIAKQQIVWTVTDIMDATSGTLCTGDKASHFDGFSIDSRSIHPRQCFICLTGDVHDGHTFIPDIIRQGVTGIILNQEKADQALLKKLTEAGITSVAVQDTLTALGDLASFHRRRWDLSVVALTGSNGKTTTRTMTTAVVNRRFKTLSPFGNFNNLVGVPLTLLRTRPSHAWAILELGMSFPGEIRRLGRICLPDIGLITNIGPAHLEGLGSLEGVMNAKGEILETLTPKDRLILNADDPMVMRLAKRATVKPILFGLSKNADIRATALENSTDAVSFQLHVPGGDIHVDLPIPGEFNVSNALAAAAVGYCLEIPLSEIKTALDSFIPVKGRMNILRTVQGPHLIDDTYNANPGSVKAALSTLAGLRKNQRGIAALGDMLELGRASRDLHAEVGGFAAATGLAKLYVTGNFADAVEKGAINGGMAARNIFCGSKDDIFDALKKTIQPDDWVLVKGSRGMRMETLVQALQAQYDRMETST